MKFRLNEQLFLEAAEEKPYFKAFITNLGKYNEGELDGDWVDFPTTKKEFNDVLDKIGIGHENESGEPYEEWFVTDYDCNVECVDPYSLEEYPTYDELQEFGKLITSISLEDVEAISNICEVSTSLVDAFEGYKNGKYVFYPVNYCDDLAKWVLEDIYGQNIKNWPKELISDFIDYERLGKDLQYDSYYNDEDEEISAGEYFCGDENATNEEIGRACVEDMGFDSIAEPENYFDFTAFGRELEQENFMETPDGYVEIVA